MRWSQEYLTTLFQRQKCTEEQHIQQKGDAVLLKRENIPPTVWPIAIVSDKFEGMAESLEIVTRNRLTRGHCRCFCQQRYRMKATMNSVVKSILLREKEYT